MKVIWSAASVRHLQEANEYLEGEGTGGASVVQKRILHTVDRLGQMPKSGRSGRIQGTREAAVPRTPYLVVYRVSNIAVEVIGIWHGARQWPDIFRLE